MGFIPQIFSEEVSIAGFLEDYGWYLFFGGISLFYVYKQFEPLIHKYKQEKEEKEYDAKYHKDENMVTKRLLAQQLRAEKLQEEYTRQAEEFKKNLERKEQNKREELLAKLNNEGGNILGSSDTSKPSKLKPDYNPLSDGGSSSNYRPPKRSCCGKGGCGKK